MIALNLPTQAHADQRITFQSFRNFVVMGYESTLTPNITQVTEASNYNWASLKYEIVVDDPKSISLSYRVLQSNSVPCQGSLSGSGSLSVCQGFVSESRQVLAGGTTQASVPSAGIALTGNSSDQFEALVTVWLDLNDDGRYSAFEPKSAPAQITFIPSRELAASLTFEVDPPGNHSGGISGWIYDSSGRESWGRGLSSILNLTRFVVYVERCVTLESPCTLASYSPTLNSHPQIQAYRFDMRNEWSGNEFTRVSLAYHESTESFSVLASKTFDYSGAVPASASTEIVAPRNSSAPKLALKPRAFERFTYLADTTREFLYSARFVDDQGQPIRRSIVDIKVDATELANSSVLSADDRPLSTPSGDSRDEIWLQRVTDADGYVQLRLSSSLPVIWQSVAIESQLRGHEAHRGGRGGFIERVIWQPAKRVFTLEASSVSPRELAVVAKLVGPVTYGTNVPTVQFVSSQNLIFTDSAGRMSGAPTAEMSGSVTYQNRLRVKLASLASGSETVKARVNIAGIWYESEIVVSFDGTAGTLRTSIGEQASSSDDVTQSPEVDTNISTFNGRIAVRVQNAMGAVVSLKVGSRWLKFSALSSDYLYLVKSQRGRTVPVVVYINGVLENASAITVK